MSFSYWLPLRLWNHASASYPGRGGASSHPTLTCKQCWEEEKESWQYDIMNIKFLIGGVRQASVTSISSWIFSVLCFWVDGLTRLSLTAGTYLYSFSLRYPPLCVPFVSSPVSFQSLVFLYPVKLPLTLPHRAVFRLFPFTLSVKSGDSPVFSAHLLKFHCPSMITGGFPESSLHSHIVQPSLHQHLKVAAIATFSSSHLWWLFPVPLSN